MSAARKKSDKIKTECELVKSYCIHFLLLVLLCLVFVISSDRLGTAISSSESDSHDPGDCFDAYKVANSVQL